MFHDYDKNDVNAITLTADDVAADWRNGLLRASAHVLIQRGTADGEIRGQYGVLQGYDAGSLAEHFHSTNPSNIRGAFIGTGTCRIVEVVNVQEDTGESWTFDSFDSQKQIDDTLTGTVTCEHGNKGVMRFRTYLGGLMSAIMDVDATLRAQSAETK